MFNTGIDAHQHQHTQVHWVWCRRSKYLMIYFYEFLSSENDCKYFLRDGLTQEDESDKRKIKKTEHKENLAVRTFCIQRKTTSYLEQYSIIIIWINANYCNFQFMMNLMILCLPDVALCIGWSTKERRVWSLQLRRAIIKGGTIAPLW